MLTQEVCGLLDVKPDDVVVDATIGAAGHAKLFADSLGSAGILIGLDVDPANLRIAESTLAGAACSAGADQISAKAGAAV